MQIILIIAMLPAFILMYLIYRMDKVEREPVGLIIKLFFLGMLSTIIASCLESAGQTILNLFIRNPRSTAYNLIMYFIVVGISEEGAKYAMTRKGSWRSSAFNYHFDGVVYATAVALGFAAAENVLYILNYGLGVAPIRAVTAIPMHCIAGIFMGHYYGMAKQYSLQGRHERTKFYNIVSVVIPAILHGFYDFCASSEDSFLSTCFFIYVAVLFLISFLSIRRFARQDTPLEGEADSSQSGYYKADRVENDRSGYYDSGRSVDGQNGYYEAGKAEERRNGYNSAWHAGSGKYVRTLSELRGHDAFEFARGAAPIGHWLSDSVYLPEDTFQEKGLDQLFMEGLPGFAYFGDTIVSEEEWSRLMETAESRFPETMDVMNELNTWAQEILEQSGYITIHGV